MRHLRELIHALLQPQKKKVPFAAEHLTKLVPPEWADEEDGEALEDIEAAIYFCIRAEKDELWELTDPSLLGLLTKPPPGAGLKNAAVRRTIAWLLDKFFSHVGSEDAGLMLRSHDGAIVTLLDLMRPSPDGLVAARGALIPESAVSASNVLQALLWDAGSWKELIGAEPNGTAILQETLDTHPSIDARCGAYDVISLIQEDQTPWLKAWPERAAALLAD